jgi:hypothetical protein
MLFMSVAVNFAELAIASPASYALCPSWSRGENEWLKYYGLATGVVILNVTLKVMVI